MNFYCSICSNPNIIPEVDEPVRLMRCTNVRVAPSYHVARASREIIVQEVEIMDEWTQALKDPDAEYADNVDGGVETEEKESELDRERSQTTNYRTQGFVIRFVVQHMKAVEMETSKFHSNDPLLAGLVKDKLVGAVNVWHDAVNEIGKTLLLNLVGDITVEVI